MDNTINDITNRIDKKNINDKKENIKVSVLSIMKNEEAHLETFLERLKKLKEKCLFEYILVDTGSTDNSINIAQKFDVRIEHFNWINDFAAARNYAASIADNDWVLFLDCDEYIEEAELSNMNDVLQDEKMVYMIQRVNQYILDEQKYSYTDTPARLYNRKQYRYEGIIHEQLSDKKGKCDYPRANVKIKVNHVGYYGNEKINKAHRNNELLLKMLEKEEDPYVYFQLGQSYHILQDEEKAYYYYGKGLSIDTDEKLLYVQLMVVGYGYAMLNTNRAEQALGYEGIYDSFSHIADFVCLMGLIYLRNGFVAGAIREFTKATKIEYCFSDAANSVVPNYNLGCINQVLGNNEEAKEYYKKCGSFAPALERMKELSHV